MHRKGASSIGSKPLAALAVPGRLLHVTSSAYRRPSSAASIVPISALLSGRPTISRCGTPLSESSTASAGLTSAKQYGGTPPCSVKIALSLPGGQVAPVDPTGSVAGCICGMGGVLTSSVTAWDSALRRAAIRDGKSYRWRHVPAISLRISRGSKRRRVAPGIDVSLCRAAQYGADTQRDAHARAAADTMDDFATGSDQTRRRSKGRRHFKPLLQVVYERSG